MSHLKEREEKNCLNCGTIVAGRYCQVCGQENVQPRESFWSLATHFVYDLMHFDGKFFKTLKFLLFKPGFLTREYISGKRATYLHPIRMYVFTSAIFFLIFFTFISKNESFHAVERIDLSFNKTLEKLKDSLAATNDPVRRSEYADAINRLQAVKPAMDSAKVNGDDTFFSNAQKLPATVAAYDSIQRTLPDSLKDNFLERMLIRKRIAKKLDDQITREQFNEAFQEKIRHSVPQMLFISLPLLALVMQLLYIRKRKELYYVDHLIFLVHVFIAIFISILIYDGFEALYGYSHFRVFQWMMAVVSLYITFYMILAMYNFYRQGIFKTVLKFFIFVTMAAIIISFLLIIFIFISFLQV